MIKNVKKKNVILLIISLLLLTGVGTTLAYFVSSTEYINEFNSKKYNVEMTEDFNDTWGKKEVNFTNKENSTPVFLRVRITEEWSDSNNNIYPSVINGVDTVTKNWTNTWTNNFYKASDGWAYYTNILSAGSTITILNSISKNTSVLPSEYNNYNYNMSISYEAIQATCDAALELWRLDTCTINGTTVSFE